MLKQKIIMLALISVANTFPTEVHVRAPPLIPPQVTPAFPIQSYMTENFTAPDMAIIRSGNTAPGYLFFDPAGNGTTSQSPLIMTDRNELIWHGPSSDPNALVNYQNFRAANIHGKPYLSYWYGNTIGPLGYGSISIFDSSYVQVYNICVPNSVLNIYSGSNISYPCNHDQHESYITNDGTIIVTAYNVTSVDLTSVGGPQDGWVLSGIFHVIDIETQNVLFTWNSIDHLDSIPFTRSHQPRTIRNVTTGLRPSASWDYFHINSIQPLSDGGYLVNARHTFEMYKLNANGSIEWTINGATGGDFTLDPSIYFSWQHYARVVNSTNDIPTIALFNNDNSPVQNGTNATTGLYLSVDQTNRHVSLLQKLEVPTDPIFAVSQGNMQTLGNGHSVMGYGPVALIREFDTSGKAIYEAQFGSLSASHPTASYRAFRYKWTGTPTTAPKIVVRLTGSDTIKIFVSWNGATEVKQWRVFAGPKRDKLKSVAEFRKKGFETKYLIENCWKYGDEKGGRKIFVEVEALDGKGNVLAQSMVVKATS